MTDYIYIFILVKKNSLNKFLYMSGTVGKNQFTFIRTGFPILSSFNCIDVLYFKKYIYEENKILSHVNLHLFCSLLYCIR